MSTPNTRPNGSTMPNKTYVLLKLTAMAGSTSSEYTTPLAQAAANGSMQVVFIPSALPAGQDNLHMRAILFVPESLVCKAFVPVTIVSLLNANRSLTSNERLSCNYGDGA